MIIRGKYALQFDRKTEILIFIYGYLIKELDRRFL